MTDKHFIPPYLLWQNYQLELDEDLKIESSAY